jgi:hypothetical protein
MQANQGSSNYRSMRVAGTLKLSGSDTVSVVVYSSSDNSWTAQSESGFSCHKFESYTCSPCPANSVGVSQEESGCTCKVGFVGTITPKGQGVYIGSCRDPATKCGLNVGFNADLSASKTVGTGWHELTSYRITGDPAFYNAKSNFREQSGRALRRKRVFLPAGLSKSFGANSVLFSGLRGLPLLR